MTAISSLIGWSMLLSFALLGPVSLPAGGASISRIFIRRSEETGTYLAGDFCQLRTSPLTDSPSLKKIPFGTPLRVLRRWNSPNGDQWLQVQTSSLNFDGLVLSVTRGWVNV